VSLEESVKELSSLVVRMGHTVKQNREALLDFERTTDGMLEALQQAAKIINDHDDRVVELEQRIEVQMALITAISVNVGCTKNQFSHMIDECIEAAMKICPERAGQELIICKSDPATDVIDKMMGVDNGK